MPSALGVRVLLPLAARTVRHHGTNGPQAHGLVMERHAAIEIEIDSLGRFQAHTQVHGSN